jgi:hypothetical protein
MDVPRPGDVPAHIVEDGATSHRLAGSGSNLPGAQAPHPSNASGRRMGTSRPGVKGREKAKARARVPGGLPGGARIPAVARGRAKAGMGRSTYITTITCGPTYEMPSPWLCLNG